ncbi:RNA-directed DNA polymerase, eukaryota, reverse transcriptase zinc-binding domain protein [Tanacetum coccineum]
MHKGRIVSICNENGERFENDKIAEQFVKHFQEFLGKKYALPTEEIVFPNKLSREEKDNMCRGVSEVEVKNAMFEIEDSKAPGPDGFTARFYNSAWSIIGKDICKAVQEVFITGKLLDKVNATLISLVPKVQNPVKVSEFRPIACCNVMYKCISKIITNRLKEVLGNLIHESQSAFIASRQITDNILLAQEFWNFLKTVLEQFGFPNRMVEWIMVCVSTTKFSININGEREGYFCGGREILYDLLVFCHGDTKSVNIIKETLEEFIPFGVGKLPMKYLGVPLITKKITANNCKPLVEKVKSRILNWRNKALSYSGRLQLIASVLSAMQIYWASVFFLPKNVIYEINKMLKGARRLRDKNLQVWNEVLIVKQLWKVIAKKDTLWVKWVNTENLKGTLCDIVTSREIYNAGVSIESNIADLFVMPIIHEEIEDEVIWVDKHGKENLFSVKVVWKDFIDEETEVDWLNTQERIDVWNLDHDMKCVLCN